MAEYYISSTKCNIRERQTKLNGRVYDVYFRIVDQEGYEHQKKLSGFTSKTKAREAHADFITQHCELVKGIKKKKAEERRLAQADPLLYTMIDQYLASLSNQIKESSIVAKESVLRCHVLPSFEPTTKMSELTTPALYAWQDKIWSLKQEDGSFYSYNYLSKIRGHFSAFFEWYSSRYDKPNPFSKVKRPKKRSAKEEMKFWTREDFERFLAVVDHPMYRTMFTVLFYTGRRKGEVMALTPADVKKNTIVFNKTYTNKVKGASYKITSAKTDKTGHTPICPTLRAALAEYDPGDSTFFFGGATPVPPETLRQRFQRYCRAADMEPIRIHDLRHSFVSMLIHEGASVMMVADLIGDTVEQVIKTYGHLYQSDKIAILSRI
jgi:integrase